MGLLNLLRRSGRTGASIAAKIEELVRLKHDIERARALGVSVADYRASVYCAPYPGFKGWLFGPAEPADDDTDGDGVAIVGVNPMAGDPAATLDDLPELMGELRDSLTRRW